MGLTYQPSTGKIKDMKKTLLEIYALAVCFVTVVCFAVALGIGVYGVIQIISYSDQLIN